EAARWLLKPTVAKPFARKMGLSAQVIERTYKLVAERVPVAFDPHSAVTLRAIEAAHKLKANCIIRADWIKPISKRNPGQRTAYLMLTLNSVDQANQALKGLTLANRRVLVRREIEEPKRCARCQRYDRHFARECTAPHDICANCAGAHPTRDCGVADDPNRFHCANCNEKGHAAWDRSCPVLRAKVRLGVHQKADSGFRFFVTNAPETWISEEDELARAPPPPTVWSQIRHHFNTSESGPAATQSRLDTFLDIPEQSVPAIPLA
ncbi:hypothetical protein GY45DRAFT_1265101, partial [Cubamyces sp. BRFM 1775]